MTEWLVNVGNKIFEFTLAFGWFSFCVFCLLMLITVITYPLWVGFEQSERDDN